MDCPYCSQPIEPTPQRGGKCPHCGEAFYVRSGQAMTWAGAKEHDKAKRRKYPHESRFCPNCGDITEAGDFYFKRINPCTTCGRYIDWPNNKVVEWDDVDPSQDWFNPYFLPPGQAKEFGGSCCIQITNESCGYYQPHKDGRDIIGEDEDDDDEDFPGDEWKKGVQRNG